MPTKPIMTKSAKELASADILNTIYNEGGSYYQSMVPKVIKEGDTLPNGRIATKEDSLMSLRGIGNVLQEFEPVRNAFLNALVNRIARVMITSRLYENPWRFFKKGLLEYGETVEEIFVALANPYQYHNDDESVFKRYLPDVRAAFHSMNYQKFYPTTVSNDQLRQAFLGWQGVSELLARIIEQVYTGANYDEFLVMKYLTARHALNGHIATVTIPEVTAENARTVTTQMVAYAKNLSYMSSSYNMAGVPTYTDPRYLYMILTTDVSAIFDVEVLALSFNMDKAELIGRQIGIDGFDKVDDARLQKIFYDDPYTQYVPFTADELALLKSIKGLMVDESWFMIFDNYENMTEAYNGKSLYWNYFYHVWKTFSISPFANAILFTTDTPTITSVTLTPDTATVAKGGTLKLTPTITTTGLANKAVAWKVEGSNPSNSYVDMYGVLHVAKDEPNTSLTVTATSVLDSSKSGSATITVS